MPLASVVDSELLPFADVHIHYKANQAEVTTPEAVAAVLKDNNIVRAKGRNSAGGRFSACSRALATNGNRSLLRLLERVLGPPLVSLFEFKRHHFTT